MANTPFDDLGTEEILSTRISGIQDAVKNIEQSLNMDTEAVSEESLTLLADAMGRYRIAEAAGKRNWLDDPAPVIEQYIGGTWTQISTGFTIDYAGGAVIFADDKVGKQFRASFTRVKNTSGHNSHLSDYVLQVPYAEATGSANTYAVTLNPIPSAYVDGMAIAVKINVNNTGASTININGLGAKTIKKPNGNDVSAGNLKAGSIYSMRYNGTNFILQGSDAAGDATPGDVLSGKTFSNDGGEQTGTLELTGNAAVGDVLNGQTFYNTDAKTKVTGSMTNRGAITITPGKTAQNIPVGYHNGSGQVENLGGNATAGDVLSGKTFSSNTAGRAVSGTLVIPQNDILYSKGFICTAAGDWVIGFNLLDAGVLTKYSNYMSLTTTYNTIITPENTIDLTNYNLLIAYVSFTCGGQDSKFTLAIGPDTVHPATFEVQQAILHQSFTNQLITLDISSITGFKNVALHAEADSPSIPSSLTVYHVILM